MFLYVFLVHGQLFEVAFQICNHFGQINADICVQAVAYFQYSRRLSAGKIQYDRVVYFHNNLVGPLVENSASMEMHIGSFPDIGRWLKISRILVENWKTF